MQTKMQYLALVACTLLIIPAAAFADNGVAVGKTSIEQSYLSAMLARTTCQANHEAGYIGAVISDIPSVDQTTINADSGKIASDLQTLQSDTNNNVKSQFSTDLKLFRSDSKTGILDLRSAIKNSHSTSDQRTKLRSDVSSLGSTLKSCMFSANQQYANAKTQVFSYEIQRAENRTKNMGARGLDTTQMNQITNLAQTNLNNLAGSISSATNSSQLKTALQSYCQYNGCKSGANFHFAAQMVLAADQAALGKIQSNPNSGQYSSQINQAQTDLTNAQNILNTVGTGKYQGTQMNDVWNALHDASNEIKQLWSELHEHKGKSGTTGFSSSSGSIGQST